MILFNARIPGKKELQHIRFDGGRIKSIVNDKSALQTANEIVLELDGAIVLPGFINSHDHLDFNLFPRLGEGIYKNYRDWGPAIQIENKDLIQKIQKVPIELRVQWGLYKNLLNGFTTVVNHGEKLDIKDPILQVYQEADQIHSPAFEKNWKRKLNNPLRRNKTVVIHLGEGTDDAAREEIDQVRRSNILRRRIIAVHGVAMEPRQAEYFSGLIWCPASNYFLLGKTARIEELKKKIPIAFGTDSTLTSPWNIWSQFRQALETELVNEEELLEMLTLTPSRIWGLKDSGTIAEGAVADLLIMDKDSPLFNQNPEDILFVIQGGIPRMADKRFFNGLEPGSGFTNVRIGGALKKVAGDLEGLVKNIKTHLPHMEIPFMLDDE